MSGLETEAETCDGQRKRSQRKVDAVGGGDGHFSYHNCSHHFTGSLCIRLINFTLQISVILVYQLSSSKLVKMKN